MPEQTTRKENTRRKIGRPKGAATKAGRNAPGAGAPRKLEHPVSLTFQVERDVKDKFNLISLKRGELNMHLRAALDDYLRREDIRAKLEDVQALIDAEDY